MRSSLLSPGQIAIVLLIPVRTSTSFTDRRNLQTPTGLQKASFSQVIAQGSLHHGRQSRRYLLSCDKTLHRFSQVVWEADSCAFHNQMVSPVGEAGEYGDETHSCTLTSFATNLYGYSIRLHFMLQSSVIKPFSKPSRARNLQSLQSHIWFS